MNGLDNWLRQATRGLSASSANNVRAEIQEHYESTREVELAGGASGVLADRLALIALGDARIANNQYRRVLLTSSEARVLNESGWEARQSCSHARLKRLAVTVPGAVLLVAAALYFDGRGEPARDLLIAATLMGILLTGPLLPIYTPSRGRIFRAIKWVAMVGAPVLILGVPDALKLSWLWFSCFGPMALTEWRRASIRSKLPAAVWPKHLYL